MIVLGIETSCDDTGVAIYAEERGLLAHALHSQIALHQQYGGVVPELASRDHVKYLVPLVEEVLLQASLPKKALDIVAYTQGPGLIGSLLTGVTFAKSFAYALQKPALAVHHLEAHLLAPLLDAPDLQFPFLALLVSGGHTQLIAAHALGNYEILGDTLDDAVGEAFDKTAKLMGFPYPGGPHLARLAKEHDASLPPSFPPFPRPMIKDPGLDFSFSGLKTHALMAFRKSAETLPIKQEIAYAFQEAVVETFVIKCKRALKKTGFTRLVVAGGVSANQHLREVLTSTIAKEGGRVFFPGLAYCTDNGAMVAYAGYLHAREGRQDSSLAIGVKARWPLE